MILGACHHDVDALRAEAISRNLGDSTDKYELITWLRINDQAMRKFKRTEPASSSSAGANEKSETSVKSEWFQ